MAGLTYTTWKAQIALQAVIDVANADFVANLPSCIDFAEGKIYRELGMLVAQVRDGSASFTANSRNIQLPTSIGVFDGPIDGINVITPTATAPDSGTRHPLIFTSRDFLDYCWPSSTGAGVPTHAAYISQATVTGSPVLSQTNIIVGPWPDAAYRYECIGWQRPPALSASNTTTFLTVYLPELFVAASMIQMAGYMMNFGSQADNAQQAQSWTAQYEALKASAATYEACKRFAGASWSSKQLEPAAQPQRG